MSDQSRHSCPICGILVPPVRDPDRPEGDLMVFWWVFKKAFKTMLVALLWASPVTVVFFLYLYLMAYGF